MTGGVEVVTVDESGRPTGTLDRTEAHTGEGSLHSAISVQVISDDGRWLVQRRATDKPVFGGRWANTCCSHPLPGEAPADAARRRVREELGMDLESVEAAGTFVYRAVDPATAYVEHEHDNVFVAHVAGEPALTPDPTEIAEVAWLAADAVVELTEAPDAAPWFATVVELVLRSERPGG